MKQDIVVIVQISHQRGEYGFFFFITDWEVDWFSLEAAAQSYVKNKYETSVSVFKRPA